MHVTRDEFDAKISALEGRCSNIENRCTNIENRCSNIERILEEMRGTMKTMCATGISLFVASIGTTLGTGVAVTQSMLSHFDTVLEAYHAGARLPQDIRVVTYSPQGQAQTHTVSQPAP